MFTNSLVTLLLTLTLSAASPLPPFSDASGLPSLSDADVTPDRLSALSPITLQVAKRLNNTGSANIVKFDQARARATKLRSRHTHGAGFAPASSSAGKAINVDATDQTVSYVVDVTIGNPPTLYHLLVDTGSSNTWIGANTEYIPTFSSRPTGKVVSVTYGSGAFIGQEYIDTITLANGLTIPNQSIGVASFAEGFEGVDGILGIGPTDLTVGSLVDSPTESIPTVTDNAYNMQLLDHKEIGISFQPTQELAQKNGELTFGGVDQSKFVGELAYVPLTTTSPASEFVGYDQSIMYGEQNILNTTAGILDTGTTLILIATDAFQEYQAATGAVPDDATGLLSITAAQYDKLKPLRFIIGGINYDLSPNAQIWPRALNTVIDGTPDGIYLIVADLGSESKQGLDFINGMSFLERFYATYDIGNNQVGLAKTEYTYAQTN
ncbi:aspartic peptidase A1 [Lenzites betulinus]|nr:aspartic peptidase A1 [Lenzites betulinus]